jgi:hypothetical protein
MAGRSLQNTKTPRATSHPGRPALSQCSAPSLLLHLPTFKAVTSQLQGFNPKGRALGLTPRHVARIIDRSSLPLSSSLLPSFLFSHEVLPPTLCQALCCSVTSGEVRGRWNYRSLFSFFFMPSVWLIFVK